MKDQIKLCSEQTKITKYRIWINELLIQLAEILNMPGIAVAYVTDKSRISDFIIGSESKLELISSHLGIKVDKSSLLWKTAARLHCSGSLPNSPWILCGEQNYNYCSDACFDAASAD